MTSLRRARENAPATETEFGNDALPRFPWKVILLCTLVTGLLAGVAASVYRERLAAEREQVTQKAMKDAGHIASAYAAACVTGAVEKRDVRSVEGAIALLRAGVMMQGDFANPHLSITLSEGECALAKQFLRLENGYLVYQPGIPPGEENEASQDVAHDIAWYFNCASRENAPGTAAITTPDAALALLETGVTLRTEEAAPASRRYRMYPMTATCRRQALALLKFEGGKLYCTDPPEWVRRMSLPKMHQ